MALFVACDDSDINGTKAGFEITSETSFNVGAEGDTVAVTYSIHTAIEGQSVTYKVVTGTDFLTVTQPAEGVMLLAVAANRTEAERVAVVEVCYGADATSIVVTQAAGTAPKYDVELTVGFMNGNYYGQKYGEGSDRYTIFLSDKGMNNMGQAHPNTTYYYIDAFGPVATEEAPYYLPHGTYTYDTANTGNPYTINTENSQILQSTDTEVLNVAITYAKMEVLENKIILEVEVNGELHCVTYYGTLQLTDLTDDGGGDDNNNNNDDPMSGSEKEAQSTLTDDYEITFPDQPRAKWSYEGDWWQTGYSNYVIMVMNKYNGYVTGDTLQLDFIVDNTDRDGNFYGTYECSYTPGPGVLVAGFTDSGARPVGTWYFEYGGGAAGGYRNYAMIIDGEATISDNGDGTTHIVLDAYDCHGNHITCDWNGVIEKD